MEKMYNGSPMLAPGTYVRVQQREIRSEDGSRAAIPARTFIAKVIGTDMGRSKYQIGERLAGWGEWLFADGGSWAFIGQVAEISEAAALAVPEEDPR